MVFLETDAAQKLVNRSLNSRWKMRKNKRWNRGRDFKKAQQNALTEGRDVGRI